MNSTSDDAFEGAKALAKENAHIKMMRKREHSKASEAYIDVVFKYPETSEAWEGSVPIEYRRTGVHAKGAEEMWAVVKEAYEAMNPDKRTSWLNEQREFWQKSSKVVTQSFFDALEGSTWKCVRCQLPKNPNWARRVQDIKELGYTLATDTKRFCKRCERNTTQLILLRLPRGTQTGYETLTPSLKDRILEVLGSRDAYEDRQNRHLLPDHKFPEIRWDESCREENLDTMTDEEIKAKFQLLTNQRNEQKREVCRECFQTNRRGTPFGIRFFYRGNAKWPSSVPKRGKDAEEGCVGCGWYDLCRWRYELNKKLSGSQSCLKTGWGPRTSA